MLERCAFGNWNRKQNPTHAMSKIKPKNFIQVMRKLSFGTFKNPFEHQTIPFEVFLCLVLVILRVPWSVELSKDRASINHVNMINMTQLIVVVSHQKVPSWRSKNIWTKMSNFCLTLTLTCFRAYNILWQNFQDMSFLLSPIFFSELYFNHGNFPCFFFFFRD